MHDVGKKHCESKQFQTKKELEMEKQDDEEEEKQLP